MRIIVIIKVFEIFFGAVFTGDFQQDYSITIFLTGLDGSAQVFVTTATLPPSVKNYFVFINIIAILS